GEVIFYFRLQELQIINQTFVTEFVLLGFHNLKGFKHIFFFFNLVVYIMTICGNLLIIWLVASNRSLQSPMYFFLTQLSLSDLLLTTDIVPKALNIIWNEGGRISFSGCIAQFYFFATSIVSECFLLSIMACDRYLAICNPLRYSSMMNFMLCMKMVIISWLLSFCIELIVIISLAQLKFCGSKHIDHFFCDISPILDLSCSDVYPLQLEIIILGVPFSFTPLIIIIVSYMYIVLAVLRISTTSERQKVFSTCSSHLIVVSLFYGTLIGTYLLPTKGQSLIVSRAVSLLYTVVIPMVNPIIYSLRNNDIKDGIKKYFIRDHRL
uniref:Olfactory receptor n=1 Tax=Leptobrachium leishanense TaxID=445787 RepID=A0A8C5M8X4_9ANUR